jgi:two-component system response regulator FlrC
MPLRDRPGDILPLVSQFLSNYGPDDRQIRLSERAAEMMQQYSWPGNVRELQNVVQRALVLSNSDMIDEADLMFDEWESHAAEPNKAIELLSAPAAVETIAATASEDGALSTAVKSSEYQAIMAAIRSSSNRSEAAKKLGISPRSLRYKMAQFRDRGLPLLAAA